MVKSREETESFNSFAMVRHLHVPNALSKLVKVVETPQV